MDLLDSKDKRLASIHRVPSVPTTTPAVLECILKRRGRLPNPRAKNLLRPTSFEQTLLVKIRDKTGIIPRDGFAPPFEDGHHCVGPPCLKPPTFSDDEPQFR
jgi:hypothetical protein